MPNPIKPHYSGKLSVDFWKRVNALPEPVRGLVYLAGCALQEHEGRVLQMLKEAEEMQATNVAVATIGTYKATWP